MDEPTEDRRWTLLELLNWTTEYFEGKGIESPRLNAELLLSEAAGMERVLLYARFDREVAAQTRQRFRRMVARRGEHYPLQYLLGRAEFYGRDFEVTPEVLIPRPETEMVVDKCLEKVPGEGGDRLAADIGTGSGAIAVTLACERPGLHVLATDAAEEALEVAGRNADALNVAKRVELLHGDLCEALPEDVRSGRRPLDLLASNPPYVPSGKMAGLQPEVRHEPREALDGGPDGLQVIRGLVPAAARALRPGGWLVLELGENQAEQVRELIAQTERFEADGVETQTDAGGCERVLAARTEEG